MEAPCGPRPWELFPRGIVQLASAPDLNQGNKADRAIFVSLKQALGQPNLVLTVYFSGLDRYLLVEQYSSSCHSSSFWNVQRTVSPYKY